jgi:hypothetical protein
MVNSQSPASKMMAPKFFPQIEDFPELNDNHHFFNSKKFKTKVRSSSPSKIFPLFILYRFSPPPMVAI